jgi:hypothetical protein
MDALGKLTCSTYVTGWYGIPGGPESRSTRVHVAYCGTRLPICGSILSTRQEFQFSAAGIKEAYVECKRCLRMIAGCQEALRRATERLA